MGKGKGRKDGREEQKEVEKNKRSKKWKMSSQNWMCHAINQPETALRRPVAWGKGWVGLKDKTDCQIISLENLTGLTLYEVTNSI